METSPKIKSWKKSKQSKFKTPKGSFVPESSFELVVQEYLWCHNLVHTYLDKKKNTQVSTVTLLIEKIKHLIVRRQHATLETCGFEKSYWSQFDTISQVTSGVRILWITPCSTFCPGYYTVELLSSVCLSLFRMSCRMAHRLRPAGVARWSSTCVRRERRTPTRGWMKSRLCPRCRALCRRQMMKGAVDNPQYFFVEESFPAVVCWS